LTAGAPPGHNPGGAFPKPAAPLRPLIVRCGRKGSRTHNTEVVSILRTLLLSALLLATLSLSAAAAPPAPCETPGVVSLAGEVILRIHSPSGGLDCQQRADIVQMRIVDTLSIGLVFPKDIHVKKVKKEWGVFVKDILVITADAGSAKINKTTPKQLAEVWAKNLRRTIPESTPQKYIPPAQ